MEDGLIPTYMGMCYSLCPGIYLRYFTRKQNLAVATASILVPVFYLAIIQFFGSWHFWREMAVILAYFAAMLCWLRKASARLRIYLVLGSTLRYYDEIGLLKPVRIALSGYRLYGKKEVDILQQILIYREVGFPLDEIKSIHYLLS